ncbi:MAG: NlpC/P60 family protein [Candidatus Egerieousia sp.]
MKRSILLALAATLLVMPARAQEHKDGLCNKCTEKFEKISKEIKAEYAPDSRDKIFEVKLIHKDGGKAIVGSTTEAAAKEALMAKLKLEGLNAADEVKILPDAELGEKTYGVICVSVAQFRCDGRMSGESATQALMGMPVTILNGNDGGWYRAVTMEGYIAWTLKRNIQEMTKAEYEEYLAKPKVITMVKHSTLYTKPDTKSMQICDIVLGDILIDGGDLDLETLNTVAVPQKGDGMREFIDPWAKKITYRASDVKKLNKLWRKVSTADGRTGYMLKSDIQDFNEWLKGAQPTADNVIESAKLWTGSPYTWGGTSYKGVDCSGLAKSAYFLNGYVLRRDASQQCLTGDPVDIDKFVAGELTLENLSNLKKGDLIFFGRKATPERKERITHVALYMGDGMIIHSSDIVRINSLIPGTPNFYGGAKNTVRASRIIGTADQGKGVVSVAKIFKPEK